MRVFFASSPETPCMPYVYELSFEENDVAFVRATLAHATAHALDRIAQAQRLPAWADLVDHTQTEGLIRRTDIPCYTDRAFLWEIASSAILLGGHRTFSGDKTQELYEGITLGTQLLIQQGADLEDSLSHMQVVY